MLNFKVGRDIPLFIVLFACCFFVIGHLMTHSKIFTSPPAYASYGWLMCQLFNWWLRNRLPRR